MEPDVCVKCSGDGCECIAVQVDDLLIPSKDLHAIVDNLTNNYYFELKGTDIFSFNLLHDFLRDENGILHFVPRKFFKKMEKYCFSMFGSKHKFTTM